MGLSDTHCWKRGTGIDLIFNGLHFINGLNIVKSVQDSSAGGKAGGNDTAATAHLAWGQAIEK